MRVLHGPACTQHRVCVQRVCASDAHLNTTCTSFSLAVDSSSSCHALGVCAAAASIGALPASASASAAAPPVPHGDWCTPRATAHAAAAALQDDRSEEERMLVELPPELSFFVVVCSRDASECACDGPRSSHFTAI
jgi:hypothetical protein